MKNAIYFHPEAYSTNGPKLMGRNAAGEGFLRGYFAHSQAQSFTALVPKAEYGAAFADAVKVAGRQEPAIFVTKAALQRLVNYGSVFYPGPGLGEHAWQRALFGHASWSLCGITHTLCSGRAMDAVTELLTAPVQPWDALICTSSAGKDAVQRLLQAQAEFLVARLGAQKLVLPQLPIIPLGVHCSDFVFTQEQRRVARQKLGATDKTQIVLFAGRLSFHAKAHPLAMFQALEAASRSLADDEDLLLVQFGQFPNKHIENAFTAAAHLAAPSLRIKTLDGSQIDNRNTAWSAADIFCSLSDNIQETFGLTPVEAMAAGLPTVVSDWDGYKDSIRNGVDGFRIPTLMPGAGLGTDLALRHALEIDSYDMYCGYTSSLVAVDVQAAERAFTTLLTDKALRQRMAKAARLRACEEFDWSVIIPRYEALWAELAEIRKAQAKDHPRSQYPWPARMDPFHGFASYPSTLLNLEIRFCLVDPKLSDALIRLEAYQKLDMVNFVKAIIPSDNELRSVLSGLKDAAHSAAELVGNVEADRKAAVFRALAWLAKMNLIRAVS
jgi:starch synthase